MEAKQISNGKWVVEYEHIEANRIEVFNTYEEAESFMLSKYNYMTFITRLKKLIQ